MNSDNDTTIKPGTIIDDNIKPGTVIDDKWIIIEMIGKGAMGVVYRAHQINLNRDVAIKTISEEMLRELEDDPEEISIALQRFQCEVQTMAQVRHPNILNIFDYGGQTNQGQGLLKRTGPVEYIVMEYIPGNSLRFTMSEDGLDDVPELYASWIDSYFLPILDGVEAMHRHNIFHRDLKPENIFMDGEIPKIADFGLARSHRIRAVSNSMELKGTLTYMAPEQFSDFRKADQTADIYALGKLLFEAIDGKLDQKTLPMKKVSLQHYENIENPFLQEMDEIIQKATAEDKSLRYQSVSEFRVSLIKALSSNKTKIKKQDTPQSKTSKIIPAYSKWVWMWIAICLLSVGGMSIWHFTNSPEKNSVEQSLKEITIHPDTGINLPENPKDFKLNVIARDGSKMILTGFIKEYERKGTNGAKPQLFYIDERKISVYLFVDFLNAIKEFISVENGIVKHNDIIILYIGTGSSEEDQIIFQHKRFHIKDPGKISDPVTRVTYHGALKYANFYGRELLTESDWRFSYTFHKRKYLEKHPIAEEKTEPIPVMMHGTPEKSKPQEIIVLDKMGLKIKEWIKIEPKDSVKQNDDIDLVSGVIDATMIKENINPSLRHQWEGFADVGFRTKASID